VRSLFSFEFSSLSSYWSAGLADFHKKSFEKGQDKARHLESNLCKSQKPHDQQEEGNLTWQL
jgi:hypothetical protein